MLIFNIISKSLLISLCFYLLFFYLSYISFCFKAYTLLSILLSIFSFIFYLSIYLYNYLYILLSYLSIYLSIHLDVSPFQIQGKSKAIKLWLNCIRNYNKRIKLENNRRERERTIEAQNRQIENIKKEKERKLSI